MPKKILLIDDDHGTLDLLELFLYNDYELITALNGFDGLSKAEEEQPDLITTDITMPVMDGIRFFNRAAKSEVVKHVPIVAISQFSGNNTAKSLLNMGFRGVVTKPIEKEAVLKTIADVLADKKTLTRKGTA